MEVGCGILHAMYASIHREAIKFSTVLVLCAGMLLTQGMMVLRQDAVEADLPEKAQTLGSAEGVVPRFDRVGGVIDESDPVATAEALIDAVIQVESAGRPDRVGRHGERGLMQIKRETWHDSTRLLFGYPVPFDRAFEPALNRRVGRRYMAFLQTFLEQHRSQWQSDERALLLASYNAGPGAVRDAAFNVRRLPAAVRDYVERATALHELYLADRADDVRAGLSRYARSVLTPAGGS